MQSNDNTKKRSLSGVNKKDILKKPAQTRKSNSQFASFVRDTELIPAEDFKTSPNYVSSILSSADRTRDLI